MPGWSWVARGRLPPGRPGAVLTASPGDVCGARSCSRQLALGSCGSTSILTFIFARRAVKGSPRSLLRLRIIVTIILAAIVAVLFFVSLPLWTVTEQAACGALLVGTAFIIFSRDADGLGCEAGT